jgi:Ca2+-binding EF-hand superfamily protein
LWSDPSGEDGITLSDRGAGYYFGPDITKDFLDRHQLRLILRAHEPFEDGFYHHHQDIGDGRGVVTIFSTANYPCGEGDNMGAVLYLDDDIGTYETKSFIHSERNHDGSTSLESQSEYLRLAVDDNKSKLTQAFRAAQNESGFVTCEQWEQVLGQVLDLPDVPWLEMQPVLAPTTEPDSNEIDWMAFLGKLSTPIPRVDILGKEQLFFLHKHKDKFLSIFRLLDTDGNGTLCKKEFASGMEMLNQQVLSDANGFEQPQQCTQDTEKLFHVFDLNGDGEISIEEFCHGLKESSTLQGLSESLDLDQVETLQENHKMLLMAFKYLDSDHSGAIDRDEFQKGIEILNKRLPERSKLGDPRALFDLLDLDGNGEIGMISQNVMGMPRRMEAVFALTLKITLLCIPLLTDLNEFNQLFRVI